MAIDLLNEPHGAATWGAGNPSTDWNRAAEDTANYLLDRHPTFHGLIFVEGIGPDSPSPINWGGNFRGRCMDGSCVMRQREGERRDTRN